MVNINFIGVLKSALGMSPRLIMIVLSTSKLNRLPTARRLPKSTRILNHIATLYTIRPSVRTPLLCRERRYRVPRCIRTELDAHA